MNKTKIEWTDYTWNPIKGICPVGCWYCYAKKIYQRFGWNPELDLVNYIDLQEPRKIKKPSKIFLCSTVEFFHPNIHPSWREVIFDVIKNCPQHTFQILTKMPENIDREMPDNVWLGMTSTNHNEDEKIDEFLEKTEAKIKFISYEPLLEAPAPCLICEDWIIVGRLTGYGNKHNPKREWIEQLVYHAKIDKIPIFLKDNLKHIWGEPLIQEFPKEKE